MNVVSPPAWPYEMVARVRRELDAAKLIELGDRIDAELARESAHEANVVVVGETNTGKSSLVNALIGRPDLLPVGSEVTTNIYVMAHHGSNDSMVVHFDREPIGEGGGRRFDRIDVHSWATVEGNEDNVKEVKAVELLVPSEFLGRGIALIDTPGVGGIDAAHGRVTLAALNGADALVFVADADRPFLQPELRFLEQATERVETVVFVFSKIDIKPNWRKIMDEDQRLLAAHAPQFADAPLIGVSSLLDVTARQWEERGRPAAAVAQLRDESGLPALRSFLIDRVGDKVRFVRRSRVLHLCSAGIDLLDARDKAVTQAGPELLEQLEREESRVAALETAAALWPQTVNDGFVRMRGRLQADVLDLVKEMGRHYGDSDLQPYFGRPDALRDSLLRDINAIGVEISNRLRDGVRALEESVVRSIAPADVELTEADLPAADSIATIQADLMDGPDHYQEGLKVRNVRLGYSAVAQGMSFSGIGHLAFLAFLGVSSSTFFGIGIGFGALLALAEARGHRKQNRLQELRPLVQDALQAAQQKLPLELSEVVLSVQRRLEAELRQRIKEELSEAQATRRTCQQMVQAPPEARAQAIAKAEAHHSVIADLRYRCDYRLGELAQLIAGTAVMAATPEATT